MKKIYEKNKLTFAIVWIAVYCVLQSLANPLNKVIGIEYAASAAFCVLQAVVLFTFIRKNSLQTRYGLCKSPVPACRFLYYVSLLIKHRCITAQPLIERVNLEPYLDGVELVVVGGESDREARPLDYDWVLDIREQCIRKQVNFEFRQCGTYFIKDGRQYKLQTRDLCRQAKLAGINYKCAPQQNASVYDEL